MNLRSILSSAASKFLSSYGRHINLIYIAENVAFSLLITIASFIGDQDLLLPLLTLALVVASMLHTAINVILVRKEAYPFELLYHQHFKIRFFALILVCFIALFPISYLINNLLKEAAIHASIDQIFGIISSLIVYSLLSAVLNVLFQLSYFTEARLCFKLILSILEKLPTDRNERIKFVHKNLTWIRLGFRSCNSFLAGKPFSLELKDKEQYHNAIYTAMLVGTSKETMQMSRNVERLLKSLCSKDIELRESLISLRRIAGKPRLRGRKSIADLSDMWTTTSIIDRIKSKMKSPFAVSIVGILALIVTILTLLLQTFGD